MIVDFRLRPPLPSLLSQPYYASYRAAGDSAGSKSAWHREGAPIYQGRDETVSAVEGSVELFLAELDAAGITHGILFGRQAGEEFGTTSNEELLGLCDAHPERFRAFAGVDATLGEEAALQVRDLVGAGFVGVVLDSTMIGVQYDDPRLFPTYEAALECGVPVALTSSQLIGPSLEYSNPDHVRKVALKYPSLRIVLAHANWPWAAHTCGVAFQCPNVYLLPDIYLNMRAPGWREYLDAANGFARRRFLYGSSYPSRPLGMSLRQFADLPLEEDARTRILSENVQELVGWPD